MLARLVAVYKDQGLIFPPRWVPALVAELRQWPAGMRKAARAWAEVLRGR